MPNPTMICAVCNTENDKFATICTKCGGFLQNRVPNLDLFETIWRIIENPRKAFQVITIAEHKNYAFFLYALCGISLAFTAFWYFRLGNQFENILPLILWALLIGIPLGILLCPIASTMHWLLAKLFGGTSTFRMSLGITSYALTPMIISLVIILPIEMLTFGMYLFTSNPHPMSIKPLSYLILMGFDVALMLWSFVLTVVGTHTGNQISLWKSLLIVFILYGIVGSSFLYHGKYVAELF